MEPEIYRNTRDVMIALAGVLMQLDLQGMVEEITKCEAKAPIVDPSLWMKRGRHLQKTKTVALALLEAQEKIRELMPGGEG